MSLVVLLSLLIIRDLVERRILTPRIAFTLQLEQSQALHLLHDQRLPACEDGPDDSQKGTESSRRISQNYDGCVRLTIQENGRLVWYLFVLTFNARPAVAASLPADGPAHFSICHLMSLSPSSHE